MLAHRLTSVLLTGILLGVQSYPVGAGMLGPIPAKVKVDEAPRADVPFDLPRYKANWRQRTEAMRQRGFLPVIDVESSFNPGGFAPREFAEQMDKRGVALVAFSPQVGEGGFKRDGRVWTDAARRILNVDPWRYIPTTTAGIYPAWTEKPEAFLAETMARTVADGYPLMGEFEFRHYPSPRQLKRGESQRDVHIPINGPVGHQLFNFAVRTGIPFEIHYEIEDALLPPLEEMLAKYPAAKVIWCHLGQVRYSGRAGRYGPGYVRTLIAKHPGLYFDLAFGGPGSVYPGSGERHARVWASTTQVDPQWVQVIAEHPWRFLAALDLGGDRMDRLGEHVDVLRRFLDGLPPGAREIAAYRAAWKLLFGEDF